MATGRRTTRRKWLVGLACLGLAGGWAAAAGNEAGMGEYQVKAAFLFNFTKFTDWPPSAFASATAPIVIGIVGEDPFGSTMDDVVRDEVVRERKLVVKRLRADEDLESCHVLFISRSEKERLPAVFNRLKGHPILSVGDSVGRMKKSIALGVRSPARGDARSTGRECQETRPAYPALVGRASSRAARVSSLA